MTNVGSESTAFEPDVRMAFAQRIAALLRMGDQQYAPAEPFWADAVAPILDANGIEPGEVLQIKEQLRVADRIQPFSVVQGSGARLDRGGAPNASGIRLVVYPPNTSRRSYVTIGRPGGALYAPVMYPFGGSQPEGSRELEVYGGRLRIGLGVVAAITKVLPADGAFGAARKT